MSELRGAVNVPFKTIPLLTHLPLSLLLSILFLLGIGSTLTSCNKALVPQTLTAKEAFGLDRNQFGLILDIREKADFQGEMASPAQWVPLSELKKKGTEWEKIKTLLPKYQQAVLYGATPVQGQEAAAFFVGEGFAASSFANLEEWKRAGLPTKATP